MSFFFDMSVVKTSKLHCCLSFANNLKLRHHSMEIWLLNLWDIPHSWEWHIRIVLIDKKTSSFCHMNISWWKLQCFQYYKNQIGCTFKTQLVCMSVYQWWFPLKGCTVSLGCRVTHNASSTPLTIPDVIQFMHAITPPYLAALLL